MTKMQFTPAELRAYYRGRSDAFAGGRPDYISCNTAGEREEYARGFRHAKAEDRLDADQEWDA